MSRISDAPLPEGTTGVMVNNLHHALANNPAMAPNFYVLANSIHLDTNLSARIKELAILRVTSQLKSDFEFSHHFAGCEKSGISVEEARAVRDGDFSRFPEAEKAVLALADSIEQCAVTDAVWSAAAAHLSETQMLDLVMAVAFYGCASRITLALGVPADEGYPTIGEA